MVVRGAPKKNLRAKIHLRRKTTAWSSNPKELARQLHTFEQNLESLVNDTVQGQLLRIIDGTQTPPFPMPLHDQLEFQGNVRLRSTAKKNIVEVLESDAPEPVVITATGRNGVNASTPTATSILVEESHDVFTDTFSAAQNNYAGTVSASGTLDTCDHMFITPGNPIGVGITGMLAPSAGGTFERTFTNSDNAESFILLYHNSGLSSAGNKFVCPGGANYQVNPGCTVKLLYINGFWLVAEAEATSTEVLSHSDLANLNNPNDHLWATLVNGTRAFTGSQSMGGNSLTAVNQLVMNSSSSVIVMAGGDITGIDDIVANGSGSEWNLASGTLVNASTVRFDDSTPASPGGGETGVATRSGLWRLRSPDGHMSDYGVLVYEGTSGSSSLTVDVSSIDGVDYSNGVFLVKVVTLVTPVADENRSYGEERRYWVYRNYDDSSWNINTIGSTQSWNPDSYHIGSISMSGSTLTLNRNSGTPYSDSRRYSIFLELTGKTKT